MIMRSEEVRQKISEGKKRYKFTEEHGKNIGKSKLGVARKEETKSRISETLKGHKQPDSTCPHCGETGGASNMKRWHFDNCPKITGKKTEFGPQEILVCPHCDKSGGVSNMKRWHFDNCKHKK